MCSSRPDELTTSSDFVYGNNSGFQFTQRYVARYTTTGSEHMADLMNSLIRDGTAVPYTAYAAPPTVTMPRVKGLTTGSVPSFVDLILNFAESDTTSSLATQDTWLAQLRSHPFEGDRQGRLLFYGDDTWLKLFPDFFAEYDGTSSFFVSVSRCLYLDVIIICFCPLYRTFASLDSHDSSSIAKSIYTGFHRSGQQCNSSYSKSSGCP